MPGIGGPSPKRRRTDNGPVSADSIAQANSTLQFFTGQRQNRWMMQDAAPREGESGARVVAERAQAQAHNVAARAENEQHGRQARVNEAHLPNAQQPDSAGAVSTATARGANVVDYETPQAFSSMAANNQASRKSLDRMARTASQPGLPSPAPSDENHNNNSPITAAISSPRPAADAAATSRTPRMSSGQLLTSSSGSFHSHTGSARDSLLDSTRRRLPSQPYQAQRSPSVVQGSQTSITNSNGPPMCAPPAPSSHGRSGSFLQAPPTVPSNAHMQHLQQQSQQLQQNRDANTLVHPFHMRQRIDMFEAKHLHKPEQKAQTPVNTGRLTLLREAIDRDDWFYVVLSQLHATTSQPHLLPPSVQKANQKAWHYLDRLLCPNSEISPVLLRFLCEFPAPIMSLCSGNNSEMRDFFAKNVRQVVLFLDRLPTHWDAIASDCTKRRAPPLVEDLCGAFGLSSPVLQTTAFRAIARMFWGHDNHKSIGLDKLEHLHKLDQASFFQGRRRNAVEKAQAYSVYRRTFEAWQQQEPRILQRSLLPQEQRALLPFVDFILPPDAIPLFQGGLPQATQQKHPGVNPAQIVASQQQQAMQANYAAMQMQHSRMASSGRATPSQVNESRRNQMAQIPGRHTSLVDRQSAPPGRLLVFPHESDQPRAQPTQPDTTKSALHQAHLRSPVLAPLQAVPGAPRLYRHVVAYAVSPTKVCEDASIETKHFKIPQVNFDKIPETRPPHMPGEPPVRILDEASQTYRLRCADSAKGFASENAWMEADNYWPENLYLELNGVLLEPRRKLHHNRYLPIDVTSYIQLGENKLTAVANRLSTDKKPYQYAVAIEIVGVASHEAIVRDTKIIDAAESLAAVKKSLLGSNDDDDIAITSSNLTIKLFDPYSNSKIFDTPVRGSSCRHRDCFDLEVFLSYCRREKEGWPSVVDCWRCPLCRGDVRPQTLVIDGFLVEVRKELARKNLLETRAIVVEADGSWKVKEEETNGVRSASLEREERSMSASKKNTPVPVPKKVMEIIDLDSD